MTQNTRDRSINEPMLRLNHTGYGVSLTTLINLAAFLIVGGGAFYVIRYQVDDIASKLTITPAQVNASVLDMKETIQNQLTGLQAQITANRTERQADIKDLERRVGVNEAKTAKVEQQVVNLETLMEDIRDIMRRNEERQVGEGGAAKMGPPPWNGNSSK